MAWLVGGIGRYYVAGALGEGGFGLVFRAYDDWRRALAIKVQHPDLDSEGRARFVREVRILQQVRHPNVIEIVDHGTDADGRLWYAMPEMIGGSLAEMMARPRTWDEVTLAVEQAARGLAAYHAAGGIHRDVKLDNLLVDESGTVRLADFGIARLPELTGSIRTRGPNGTPSYMAPEVWDGQEGPASDVYALGIVFWELANGCRHTTPAKPPKLLVNAPGFQSLDALYRRMTDEDPRRRPSAADVARALDAVRNRPIAVEPEVPDWVGPTLAVAGTVAAVGLGVVLIDALVGSFRRG